MNPTELPDELQIDMIMNWSYDDIVKYCMTNKSVFRICSNRAFWNLKAVREYQKSIDIITANTPALKYKILSEIFNEEYMLNKYSSLGNGQSYAKAVYYNQPQLLDELSIPVSSVFPENAIQTILELLQLGDTSLYDRVISDYQELNPMLPEEIYTIAILTDKIQASELISPNMDYRMVAYQLTQSNTPLHQWRRVMDHARLAGALKYMTDVFIELSMQYNTVYQELLDMSMTPELARAAFQEHVHTNPLLEYLFNKAAYH